MNVVIYNTYFLRSTGQPILNIGGIETLINYLLPVINNLGWNARVYQCASTDFETRFNSSSVIGLQFPAGTPVKVMLKKFREKAIVDLNSAEFIEIYGADHFSIPSNNPLAISIQNGVWWDQPIQMLTHKKYFYNTPGEWIFRLKKQFQMLRLFENCYNRVCVDHNFINWYRTCRGEVKGRVWVNPNPAPFRDWDISRENPKSKIRIIFARRFVRQKGTHLIAEVFKELIAVRDNLEITFAGEGPEEDYLRSVFSGYKNVQFISYSIDQVLDVLAQQDIAVIPSLLSEGTCFAVVEAMAAGCAVVATNFGGMTNQIINDYNGKIVLPEKDAISEALLELIDNHEKRITIQRRGWEVAQVAFSLDRWRENWKSILNTILEKQNEASLGVSN